MIKYYSSSSYNSPASSLILFLHSWSLFFLSEGYSEHNRIKLDVSWAYKIGYNIDVLRQTSWLIVNPIKVNNFAYLFACTTVGRASYWMTDHPKPNLIVTWAVGDWHPFQVVVGQAYRGLTGGFLCYGFSVLLFLCPRVCFILDFILISIYVSKLRSLILKLGFSMLLL